MRTLAVIIAVFIAGPGCDSEPVPSVPIVYGPAAGWPSDSLRFWAQSVNRTGGIEYQFDWGDGSDTTWSAPQLSAARYYVDHVFTDTGRFAVLVRARAGDLVSAWSDTVVTEVAEFGPERPRRPHGTDTVRVGRTYSYVTITFHRLMVPVFYRFDWGDTLGDWSGAEPSGGTFIGYHAFSRPGSFAVRVQARDERDHLSAWSDPETVLVIDTVVRGRVRPLQRLTSR